MRRELVDIMLTCGLISYEGLHMMEDEHAHRMYTRTLKKMIAEGTADIVRYKRKKMCRLLDVGNKGRLYIPEGDGYIYDYYEKFASGYASNSACFKSDKQRCKRALLNSETLLMMHGAGIDSLYYEKADISDGEIIPKIGAYYYSILEVKSISSYHPVMVKNAEKKKEAQTSRAFGFLISGDNKYIVYNISDNIIKWSAITESQLALTTGLVLPKITEAKVRGKAIDSCIVLYKTEQALLKAYSYSGDSKHAYINAETGYAHSYYIPYNQTGKAMLRILTIENWKEKLKNHYLQGKDTDTRSASIVCDAISWEAGQLTYYLLYCIPDLTRLYKFLMAAQWNENGNQFIIYCYTYQTAFLKQIAGGLVEIYETPLKEEIMYAEEE